MTEPLSLLTALLLGLFGSSHCLVMCGGIGAAIGSQPGKSPFLNVFAFNLGRITTYVIFGGVVSVVGLWLQQLQTEMMLVIRSLAGVLLVLMGLYVGRWLMWLTHFEQAGQHLWKRIQPATGALLTKQDTPSRLLLGMLWGLLPCGLIYSTLSWVAANGDPVMGMLSMLFFGLGTLPALFASSLAARSISTFLNLKSIKQLAGALLVGYGLWTLWAIWH